MRADPGFVERDLHGTHLWIREDYHREELLRRIDLETLPKDAAAVKIQTGRLTSVFKLHWEGRDLFIKFFLYKHWRHVLKAPFLKTRGRLAWENAGMLLREGFQTPPVIMVGEKRVLGFVQKSFFVTEAIEAVSLRSFFKESFEEFLLKRTISRRDFFYQLGRVIGSLHAKGVYHGDLNLGNLWVAASSGCGLFDLYFLDNEGARPFRSLPKSWRLHDLRDLNDVHLKTVTLKDRLCFLRAYLKENPSLHLQKKRFVQDLIEASFRRHKRK
jgi:tRNA A-37 threonylcarbamoyl transferase component Bud32